MKRNCENCDWHGSFMCRAEKPYCKTDEMEHFRPNVYPQKNCVDYLPGNIFRDAICKGVGYSLRYDPEKCRHCTYYEPKN